MSFPLADLNIPQAELDDLRSALANTDDADPWPNLIAEAELKVRDWTARYLVPEDTLKRLWRPIALYNIYALAGTLSAQRQKAYDDALKELTDIRDGKFTQYAPATEPPPGDATASGAFGSDTFISTR